MHACTYTDSNVLPNSELERASANKLFMYQGNTPKSTPVPRNTTEGIHVAETLRASECLRTARTLQACKSTIVRHRSADPGRVIVRSRTNPFYSFAEQRQPRQKECQTRDSQSYTHGKSRTDEAATETQRVLVRPFFGRVLSRRRASCWRGINQFIP